jgi:DNA-binding transcriptional MerR regulator
MDGVTIGQAAAFAGVTVKTVRVYHRQGLIDEPRRDQSGCRRYGSDDLLRLVQIRTLAGAGVPLAEIGDLLDADQDRFAATVLDVERRLTDRIEELVARRDTLRRLADGDRVLLPDRACALLDQLPGLGFTADDMVHAREGLVLVRALVPDGCIGRCRGDALSRFPYCARNAGSGCAGYRRRVASTVREVKKSCRGMPEMFEACPQR